MNRFSQRLFKLLMSIVALATVNHIAVVADDVYNVGVAKIDITPQYPIRLNGFGFRREECEGITQPIFAKALAIGWKEDETIILFTIDSTGIREAMIDKVAAALNKAKGIRRENVIATFTHTHTAPKLKDVCDTVFSTPIPAEHQRHIDQYDAELTAALEIVALEAIAKREPSRLEWGVGNVGFAKNRRTEGGPVDHGLPVLVVRSVDDDAIRAVYTTYACHCVTLSNNQISGDWAGFAQHAIEVKHPGSVAMVSIGCGSDANPDSGVVDDKTAVAANQGSQIAAEVERLLGEKLVSVKGPVTANLKHIDLPLSAPPSHEELKDLATKESPEGYNAKFQLQRLDRGEKLMTKLDYPIQTLKFGDSLAMIFLGGEVCVDYATRLRRELDASKIWLHGYSNDFCAYISSERLLKEGGYGGGAEIVYFGLPAALAPGLEDKIIAAVREQIPPQFRAKGSRRQARKQPWPLKDALASIQVHPEFVVEVVAAEPLVADPVAIDFALDGSMWVADMTDYTKYADDQFDQTGSVRLLRDLDGDGQFDKSFVFEAGLRFPTDVKTWGKGVVVCDAPNIIYLEDTDGDEKADVRRILLTGFATDNAQARVNSLRWGLDNWLYGSCGLLGGTISTFTGKKLELGGRDFRFRPESGEIEPATGKTQQGRARDDWGNWFGCDSGALLDHYPLTDQYLTRNPYLTPPPAKVYVPAGRDPNQLYPIGEPTLFKLSGPPGRPTSVCGLDFYRDDLLGDAFRNNAFVAEPVNHLIHRLSLSPRGTTFEGHRAKPEQDREFLASDDPWFRPVQIRAGLDGCLYVVDMHRAVIEHPKFIPEETLRELNLMGGQDQGRIYRVRPKNRPSRNAVRLDHLNASGLAAAIDSPNGTQRDLVHQTLVGNKATEVSPRLEQLVRSADTPVVRLQALCTLDGLGTVTPAIVVQALNDENPGVRRHAIRLSESFAEEAPQIAENLLRLVDDPDPQVQLQLACSLGEFTHKDCQAALARLAWTHRDDPYILAGVWSSINRSNVGGVVQTILGLRGDDNVPDSLLETCIKLTTTLGTTDDLRRLAGALNTTTLGSQSMWRLVAAAKLLKLSRRQDGSIQRQLEQKLASLIEAATALPDSEGHGDDLRLAALQLVLAANPDSEEALTSLVNMLGPQHAPEVQQAAIELIGSIDSAMAGDALLDHWNAYSPATRSFVFDVLVGKPTWADSLVTRLEAGDMQVSELDALQRERLLTHLDQGVRDRAVKELQAPSSTDRQQVVEAYLRESKVGDSMRGRVKFNATCASCHELEGQGHDVGPDLTALTNRSRRAMFESILDPNRAIDERYRSYTVLTIDGIAHTGLLASETSTSITLVEQQGKSVTILRSDVEVLKNTGKSLMPDGLENDLQPQNVADIVAFVTSAGQLPKSLDGNNPTIVVPDHNGIVWLTASNAEIYGGDVTFESTYNNIGYWHDEGDHVDWKVKLPNDNVYDIYMEWASTVESAGSQISVEGGASPVKASIESTAGYERYNVRLIGKIMLASGECRIVVHSDGPLLKRNLMDLRGIYLVPTGTPFSRTTLKLGQRRGSDAADDVARLAHQLAQGVSSERMLIPDLWELAIAAGRRNETKEVARLIDVALPKEGQAIVEWQAVVLGGGVVNGISQSGDWPRNRLAQVWKDLPDLRDRWNKALETASELTDDTSILVSTRYDALRILGTGTYEDQGAQLTRYLHVDNSELQAGAACALADLRDSRSTKILINSFANLSDETRTAALDALLRIDAHVEHIAQAIADGRIATEWLSPHHLKILNDTSVAKDN
jgi:putative membrane-bound dehydrogenase-like protein